MLLDRVTAFLLIGKSLVKGLILASDVLALCLQLLQLGLTIFDISVRFHIVKLILFVKLIVLVLDDAQLAGAVGVAFVEHLRFEGG